MASLETSIILKTSFQSEVGDGGIGGGCAVVVVVVVVIGKKSLACK